MNIRMEQCRIAGHCIALIGCGKGELTGVTSHGDLLSLVWSHWVLTLKKPIMKEIGILGVLLKEQEKLHSLQNGSGYSFIAFGNLSSAIPHFSVYFHVSFLVHIQFVAAANMDRGKLSLAIITK